jgi:uracil-DNA glycosylase family 4
MRARSEKGGGRRSPAWIEDWEELTAHIRRCTWCHLATTRRHAVPYRGSLLPKVVFVGEAPGKEEDATGLPFVGAAGRVLDRALMTLGLTEEEVGILNVFKCHPPGNVFDRVAARACRPHLERQMALLTPRVVVTLGAHALRWFDPGAPRISEAAGHARSWRDLPLFPLVHPAATFRSRAYAERWKGDLARLSEALPPWLGEGV